MPAGHTIFCRLEDRTNKLDQRIKAGELGALEFVRLVSGLVILQSRCIAALNRRLHERETAALAVDPNRIIG